MSDTILLCSLNALFLIEEKYREYIHHRNTEYVKAFGLEQY